MESNSIEILENLAAERDYNDSFIEPENIERAEPISNAYENVYENGDEMSE